MLLNYDSWFWWIWQDYVLLALLLRPKQRAGLCARMCRENPQPCSLALCVQPFSLGSDWWKLYEDNLAQNPPLSLSPTTGLELFQTSLSAVFFLKGICIQGQHLLVLCESLHWALSKECQTLKALAEICGDSVYYFLSHSSNVLWFWDSMNKKLTNVMFRQKWDINHDRKM